VYDKKINRRGYAKAVIIPSVLTKRYNLKKIVLEATEEGILIRPVETKSSFQRKLERLRRNKRAIYRKMEAEANDPKTLAFYNDPDNTFEDVDPDVCSIEIK
jgi:antitoxin component of MazEF toxin-antitoxin module